MEKCSGCTKYKNKIQISTNNTDCLSALPEHIIHHILSFLPSTKDAAKTSILSKSWCYKWNHVPNLIFSLDNDGDENKVKRFFKFIDNALFFYAGSEMEKFVLNLENDLVYKKLNSQMPKWLQFVMIKNVKEVTLDFFGYDQYGTTDWNNFRLPQCFYDNTNLVKLKTCCCNFVPSGRVNWLSLKSLHIECADLTDEIMESILSGSPFLEYLGLDDCFLSEFGRLHYDSKCMKRLALHMNGRSTLEFFKISGPSIESFEIVGGYLLLDNIAVNVPLVASATIDFRRGCYEDDDDAETVQHLFKQVMQAKELKMGSWCLQAISYLELKAISLSAVENQSSPSSKIECLILNVSNKDPFLKYVPGIVRLLQISSNLEKLVINFGLSSRDWYMFRPYDELLNYHKYAKNLISQNTNITCLSSHIKIVEIIGFRAAVCDYEVVLEFLEFLLKNASVLEKMVIYNANLLQGKLSADFVHKASERLLTFKRASPYAKIIFQE